MELNVSFIPLISGNRLSLIGVRKAAKKMTRLIVLQPPDESVLALSLAYVNF